MMNNSELQKRIDDIKSRSQRATHPLSTTFLTPAEQYDLKEEKLFFAGLSPDDERKIAVFLPEWMEESEFDVSSLLSALKIQSYFGVPTHRDYLGAVLGIGIKREWIGDIVVIGDAAYIVCMNSVADTIKNELSRVGKISVKVSDISPQDIPNRVINTKTITFTVKSMRLDSICGSMFGLSRTNAQNLISEGLVSHNYKICVKNNMEVNENDIISIKGYGKGIVSNIGGKSRKDRMFVTADIFK